MNYPIAIDDGIAVRGERAAQGYIGIEGTGLVEVDYAQPIGAANLATGRSQVSLQQSEQRCLATAIRAYQADTHSGREDEAEPLEQRAISHRAGDALQFDQALSLAIGGGKVDLRCGTPRSLIQVG